MASFGVGAKLRQERIGRGFTIADIARETRIPSRYLEAIEADNYESLPGLVFARNFVRQFAQALDFDPDPLIAELPKLDESTIRLPDPPARPRSSYQTDRRLHSGVWLGLAAVAAIGAWFHFNRSVPPSAAPVARTTLAAQAAPAPQTPPPSAVIPEPAPSAAVQVVITAHQPAWVQVSADGKNTFTGTLQPDESKQISAAEQVKLVAGNAGGLTVSLNGKTLQSLGSIGQVRVLRLTAGGPEFLVKDSPSALAPL